MKKRFMVVATAALVGSSIMFSSCIGSFSLFNKLLSWNRSVSDKWINELIFIVISPAYGVASFVDVLILNSIEFWTGDNPVSAQVQEIETEKGQFTVTTDANGHKIQKEGSDEIVEFRFNTDKDGWDLLVDETAIPLFKFAGNDQALVYLADGSTMTVDLNQAGLMAFRQVMQNKAYFATK